MQGSNLSQDILDHCINPIHVNIGSVLPILILFTKKRNMSDLIKNNTQPHKIMILFLNDSEKKKKEEFRNQKKSMCFGFFLYFVVKQ